MMQCNPMSRPGKWHQNGRNVSVLLFGSPRSSRRPVVATEQLYKFLASLYLKFVVQKSNSFTFNILRCIPRRYRRCAVLREPRTGKNLLSKVKGVLCWIDQCYFQCKELPETRKYGVKILAKVQSQSISTRSEAEITHCELFAWSLSLLIEDNCSLLDHV